LEVADSPAARVALLKQYLALAKEVEGIVAAKADAGRVEKADLHRARYIRLDAEVRLLRAQAKAKDRRGK
jgi:outer membrane protein TolC